LVEVKVKVEVEVKVKKGWAVCGWGEAATPGDN
jgi:hypothetical protein